MIKLLAFSFKYTYHKELVGAWPPCLSLKPRLKTVILYYYCYNNFRKNKRYRNADTKVNPY